MSDPADTPPVPAAPPPPTDGPPPLPAKPPTPAERIAAFQQQLRAFTPRVWITYALIGINVAVFVAGVATGVHPISPTIDSLIHWGADYGPRTVTGGEWWRLVSNCFLHIGAFHILMNMVVLWSVGRFVEPLLGNAGFAVVYLLSGVAGSCASLGHNPFIVSAGASGAVFGLYGALVGVMLRARGSIPREVLTQLQKSAVLFIIYNLAYGAAQSGIDMAAHVGGLVAGFAGGLVLGHPLDTAGAAGRMRRNLVLAIAGVACLGGVTFALPRPVDFQAEIHKFGEMESRTLNLVNDSAKKNDDGTVTNAEFGRVLGGVVPEWRAAHDRLAALPKLPEQQSKIRDQLVDYIAARADGWQLVSDGLVKHDPALIEQGRAKRDLAEQLAKKIGK